MSNPRSAAAREREIAFPPRARRLSRQLLLGGGGGRLPVGPLRILFLRGGGSARR